MEGRLNSGTMEECLPRDEVSWQRYIQRTRQGRRRREEEGNSRRGQAGAGAAEVGDSGVLTGGQGQTGKRGKGQAAVSGARHATGHQEGKEEKGAHRGDSGHSPNACSSSGCRGRPHRSVRRCGRRRRWRRRQQTARYEALVHMERQRRRRQAPGPGLDTIYRLDMGSGRGRSERQGGQEGSGGVHSGQPSDGPQRGEGQAGQSNEAATGLHSQREEEQQSGGQRSGQAGSAVRGTGAGLEESGKNRHSGHGAQGIGEGQEEPQGKGQGKSGYQGADSKGQGKAGRAGKGQGKAGGVGTWGHGYSQGRDWVGGEVSFASHPTISATTLPCGRDGVPTPTGLPGCTIASVCAAAPAGRLDGVWGTGREWRGAQESMGEDRGGREEIAGEGSTDHGRSGQGGAGKDRGTGHATGRGGAGS